MNLAPALSTVNVFKSVILTRCGSEELRHYRDGPVTGHCPLFVQIRTWHVHHRMA